MNREQKLIENGEGYWCFEKPKPQEPTVGMDQEAGLAEAATIESVRVHRPVIVETDDGGELFAYYYDSDAEPMDVLETGGKRFVPIRQVYVTPLTGYETPAYKVED